MRKKLRKIIATVLTTTMIMSVGISAFAMGETDFDDQTAKDAYQYFLDRGVASEKLDMLDDELLEGIMRQAEAYGFSDLQVQQFIDGQIFIITSPEAILHETDVTFSEDGSTIITSHGEYPDLLRRYDKQFTNNNESDDKQFTNENESDEIALQLARDLFQQFCFSGILLGILF